MNGWKITTSYHMDIYRAVDVCVGSCSCRYYIKWFKVNSTSTFTFNGLQSLHSKHRIMIPHPETQSKVGKLNGM